MRWIALALASGLALLTGCRGDCEDLAAVCAKCPEAVQKQACEFAVAEDDADFCDAEIEEYVDAGCQ
jgi:hypothetical protein